MVRSVSWKKSSLSHSDGQCVEVAQVPGGGVWVRHSRFPDGPVLSFTQAEWAAFVGGACNGEFSSPDAGAG